jgi:solute carrier family 35 protein
MFLTVRRATTVFTLIAEYFMLGKLATLPVTFGVSLTVLGALVAGHESLSADWLGFTYTLLNNALTAMSWSATKLASDQHKVTRFGLTFYNACIALPLCVLLSIANDEPKYLLNHPHIGNPLFLFALLGASCLGVLMNWVTFLAITMTSPLATSVTGNVKDIGGTFLGAMIFQDFVPTPAKVIGIIISFAGSAIFSWAKLAEVKSSSTVLPTTSDAKEGLNNLKSLTSGGGGDGILSPRWSPSDIAPRIGGVNGNENDSEKESSGSSLLRGGHTASRSRIVS